MNKKIALIFAALLLVLAACGAKAAEEPMYVAAPERALGGGQDVTSSESAPAYDSSNSVTPIGLSTQERMIIMTVDTTIVVADPTAKAEAIDKLAKSLGGWVVSMNMNQAYAANGEPYPQVYISIRIPAESLDDALSQIKADVVEVQYENRSSQDVTASYVDLQSQLTNLEMAEADLQAIMDEAKNNPGNDSTTKTQDVLNVYNQIVNVRGQIEQIKGQMKYYEESSSTSLINVTLIAEETIQPLEIGGWKPAGVARDAIQSLIKFLQGFVNFVIWLVLLILPVIVVVFGPIALIIWAIVAGTKRRKAKKAKSQ